MTESSKRLGPFDPLDSSSARDAIERVFTAAESSGLPCTYLSLRHTQIERDDGKPRLERLLIDLGGSDVCEDLEESVAVRPLDGSVRVTTTTTTRYRPGDAGAVLDLLKAGKLEGLCDRQRWFASAELVTGDWNYWIDPANEWPVWSCVFGCDVDLKPEGPSGGRGGDGGLPRQVSLAAHLSGGTVGLMPFVAVRLKQDLIRIGRGGLRRLDARTEEVTVPFALGTLGWNYALSNRAELRFKLLGEKQAVVHQGSMPLGEDELRYGVLLGVPAGTTDDRRIFGTDLELLLNGTVVDRALVAYIRSIQISVKMKGG